MDDTRLVGWDGQHEIEIGWMSVDGMNDTKLRWDGRHESKIEMAWTARVESTAHSVIYMRAR